MNYEPNITQYSGTLSLLHASYQTLASESTEPRPNCSTGNNNNNNGCETAIPVQDERDLDEE